MKETEHMNETKNSVENLGSILLTDNQKEICKILKKYYDKHNINKPITRTLTEIYEGAIYAMETEPENNPDWMSQAAHSFRELLYPIYDNHGSLEFDDPNNIGRIYGKFTNICHHGSIIKKDKIKEELKNFDKTKFKNLITEFETEFLNSYKTWLNIQKK